ncbi:hypothetical protein B0T14DRAFT_569103 [Immersiella caudata]|uniref:Uncharacterized protein n=1 Tax=Immersiella caudata TaxID=314043 RepID=A0AA39WLH2_9PEZI|nr:hypothetical protein B0T14DRAFT_569103 [Immersiella caudata]
MCRPNKRSHPEAQPDGPEAKRRFHLPPRAQEIVDFNNEMRRPRYPDVQASPLLSDAENFKIPPITIHFPNHAHQTNGNSGGIFTRDRELIVSEDPSTDKDDALVGSVVASPEVLNAMMNTLLARASHAGKPIIKFTFQLETTEEQEIYRGEEVGKRIKAHMARSVGEGASSGTGSHSVKTEDDIHPETTGDSLFIKTEVDSDAE